MENDNQASGNQAVENQVSEQQAHVDQPSEQVSHAGTVDTSIPERRNFKKIFGITFIVLALPLSALMFTNAGQLKKSDNLPTVSLRRNKPPAPPQTINISYQVPVPKNQGGSKITAQLLNSKGKVVYHRDQKPKRVMKRGIAHYSGNVKMPTKLPPGKYKVVLEFTATAKPKSAKGKKTKSRVPASIAQSVQSQIGVLNIKAPVKVFPPSKSTAKIIR
ncbi:MAG: hypothetical protein V4736_01215 [Bdellovibrionota bacterium]